MAANQESIPVSIADLIIKLHTDAVLWKAGVLWAAATDPDSEASAVEEISKMLLCIKNDAKRLSYINSISQEQTKKAKATKKALQNIEQLIETKERTLDKVRSKKEISKQDEEFLKTVDAELEQLNEERTRLEGNPCTELPQSLLKKQLKELEKEKKAEVELQRSRAQFEKKIKSAEDADLPPDFDGTTEDIYNAIKYGIYEHEGIIWARGQGADKPISNFTLKVVYHAKSDSDTGYRLVNITNVFGFTNMIMFKAEDFVSAGTFKKIIANYGNYIFKGQDGDLARLQERLQKDEVSAKLITQMGWHNKGFYVFANGIVPADAPNETFIPVDENGIIEYADQHFFIPAMSRMYADKEGMYSDEKKFIYAQPDEDFTFEDWAQLFYKVYKEKAFIAIPFFLGSLFRDIIYKILHRYPILNLYGPPGAGKGEMAESLLCMFGEMQEAVMLEAGSTTVGFQRKLSQLCNALLFLDEYKNSLDKKFIGALKAIYDGKSKTTGQKSNDLQTQNIPVKSAAILGGQDMPTADSALFMRCIMVAFKEGKFTDDDRAQLEKLKTHEQRDGGLSYITANLLLHRRTVEKNFKGEYNNIKKEVFNELPKGEIDDRMIINISIMLAVLKIFEPVIKFPFRFQEVKHFLVNNMKSQHTVLKGNNDINKFWQIIESLHAQRLIKEGREFLLNNGMLYLRLNLVFPFYIKEMLQRKDPYIFNSSHQLQHYMQQMKDVWVENKKKRFPDGSNSTCEILRYAPLGIDLIRVDHFEGSSDEMKRANYDNKAREMGVYQPPDASTDDDQPADVPVF